MRLIRLVVILILGLPLRPVDAEAQQTGRSYRIGWLVTTSDGGPRTTFREAMRELGYIEGQNLVFDARSAEGKTEQFPALAADLVGTQVDIIVAVALAAIRAAKLTGVHMLQSSLDPKRLESLLQVGPSAKRIGVLTHHGPRTGRRWIVAPPALGLRVPQTLLLRADQVIHD